MANKIKVSFELYLLVFILSFFILGLGFYGHQEIKKINENSHTLYADRILPMDNLADIRYYSTSILSVAYQAKTKQITFKEASRKVKQAQDSIDFNWKTYKQTFLSLKESQIVDATSVLMKKSNETIEKLGLALERNDADALNQVIDSELYETINPVIAKMGLLLNLQIQIGREIDTLTSTAYKEYFNKIIYMLIAVFAFSIPFTYYLIKKNKSIIDGYNLSNDQLTASENNYRNTIEYAGEAILIADEFGQLVNLNDIACNLFGYSREELLQMNISEIVPSSELKKQAADIENVRENKTGIVSRTIKRKDGTELETEITIRLMENNGVFSIIRDITERKRTERIIKESEEKYHSLIENAGDAIFLVDKDLNIAEVNGSACELLGYTRAELQGMNTGNLYPREDIEKYPVQVGLLKENKILTNETKLQRKDGTTVEVEVNRTLLNDNSYLGIVRDITKRKKTEAELSEKKAQLDLFIEHSPAALAMFDNEMKYIASSHRWMSDYNLGNQDIIGKSHYEVFPDINEDWKAIHKRCLDGVVEKNEEDLFVRADGSEQWVRWEIRPWHKITGEIGGIIMFTEIITERKLATERFKIQFDNAPDTILYINRNLKIETINRSSPDKTQEELIGVDCISLLPEESRQIVKEAINVCFETAKPQEIECALTYGRWVRSRFVPIFNKGQVTHIIIFSTDLTERKKAEEKLSDSEEKHRVLTENINDAILLVDKDSCVKYHSPSAERITGYSPKEAVTRSMFDFLHPDEYDKAKISFMEAHNSPGVAVQNQFRIINKKGETIWVEGTILNLLADKNIEGFIVNYRDITNRKKFEEQQTLIASIVNSSDDGIISKNIDGIITSWNLGAENILGYTAAETIGKHISILLPFERRGEERKILEAVRGGYSVDHYETQRLKKNGEIIDVSLTISPIKDSLGNIVGASKIMRDITDRKKFENDLIHYNAELKKANSELDRFVYSASHDLRAPLKSMLGLISVTKDDIDKDAILRERLTMLENSVLKLDDFIEDILNYSRNARVGLDEDEIDFEKIVNGIQKSHKFMDDLKDLEVRVEIQSNGKFISDSGRISIIFNNILSNAIKYQDATQKKSFLNILITYNNGSAVIVVEDNGIGISDKDKDKVFDMFYRATTISTGSGLGLYIVKETLEKLGGKIDMESELGKGTKLIIEIPNRINSLN